jgi:hypothetical protein
MTPVSRASTPRIPFAVFTTATFARMCWSRGTLDGSAEHFPYTIQLGTNVLRNTN